MDPKGKAVLITGSTDGVGRLVARRLADQGAHILIHGRDRRRGKQLVDQIQEAGAAENRANRKEARPPGESSIATTTGGRTDDR